MSDLKNTITASLKSGRLNPKNLPKTDEGLAELRGYSAPKEYGEHQSNAKRTVRYVRASIRIKKQNFQGFDLSLANFEKCDFWNCQFTNSKYFKTRLKACSFNSCHFSDIVFESTDLAHCTFGKDIFRFKTSELERVVFQNSNLSKLNFIKVILKFCTIDSCKTGSLIIANSDINGLKFEGDLKDVFIQENKNIENINFDKANVAGLQVRGTLENQHELLQSVAFKDYFFTALKRLGSAKLDLSDIDLEYEIFEELDVENISYLHEFAVNRLIDNNLIPANLRKEIHDLRITLIGLMETKRTITEFRTDQQWKDVRERATNIIENCTQHRTKPKE
ncbi:MAG: pentapeptide repeat-containing protein [Crocinitomicaceae bacterium]